MKAIPGGTLVSLHVQPRASRTELTGMHGLALRLRVAAPPVDGAANEAVLRFFAKSLGVPQRAVSLEAGLSSRSKTVRIEGLTPEDVAARLGLP